MTVQLYFKLISMFDRFFHELTEHLLGNSPIEKKTTLTKQKKKIPKEAEEYSVAFFESFVILKCKANSVTM